MFGIDNAKLRHLLDDPLVLGIRSRDPFAGVWIFDIAKPAPDQTANIQLVVQDAGTAPAVATDGAGSLGPAERSRDVLGVELVCDGPAGMAGRVFLEDPPDDCDFGLIDLATATDRPALVIGAFDHVIAVAKPASRLARLDPTTQAAPGLVGEILQIERIHRALQADMQVRDLALRKRDDANAGEAHALVKAGDVLLVTGKTLSATASRSARLANLSADQNRRRQAVYGDVTGQARQRESELRATYKEKLDVNYQKLIATRESTLRQYAVEKKDNQRQWAERNEARREAWQQFRKTYEPLERLRRLHEWQKESVRRYRELQAQQPQKSRGRGRSRSYDMER